MKDTENIEKKAAIFAKNVRFLRKAVGINIRGHQLSQAELADEFGVTRRIVIIWESNSLPHRSTLEKMAKYFSRKMNSEISPEDLMTIDLSKTFDIAPMSKAVRGLSREQRGILDSIFLSAKGIPEEQLKKVLDYMIRLKKRVEEK
jgi:transcriptional regulator with XRE-family HTH domain